MSGDVPVDHDLVLSVVDQVWEALLQAPATPWQGPEPSDPEALSAQIALTGDWNGLVRLSCDAGTAERIAARMLSIADGEELLPEDVHDAVGEMVNVVGGNFKGALGSRTALGLPVVSAGIQPVDAPPASRCVLDWLGRPVVVEVFAGAGPVAA